MVFTKSQEKVFWAVKNAIEGSRDKHIMIAARGGTGKTFLLNRLLYYVRTLPNDYSVALAVGSSGIAGQLLQGGRTFHSRFKFDLKPHKQATCNIPKQSGLARLIIKANMIVWDEASMSNKVML